MNDFRNNQFSKPRGFKGKLAGILMTYGKGNRFRRKWTIGLMKLKPTDVVLEIGFGTGMAIQEASQIISSGVIYGIDESDVMVKTAIKNNSKDIDAKKVLLYNASANNLPIFEKTIDKVFAINSFEFWDDKINALRMAKKYMSKKGEIFIIHEILHAKGEPSINELGDIYSEYLQKSGFKNIKIEKNLQIEILCVKAVSG